VNTTISLDNISVSNTDQYSFKVVSPTNIDWASVSWLPVMTFTGVADPSIDLTQTTIQARCRTAILDIGGRGAAKPAVSGGAGGCCIAYGYGDAAAEHQSAIACRNRRHRNDRILR